MRRHNLFSYATFLTAKPSNLQYRRGYTTSRTLPVTGSAPRLMRTGSYELIDPDKVAIASSPYAILSHTWRLERDEITFKDMTPERLHGVMAREAFRKIRLTCEQATRDGLEYVWIDTCCIDKSSSADLSEAINSMFAWYALAKVCYVYLSDVEMANGQEAFRQSRWFTRAWTLQELLAPTELRFYDKNWKFLGRLSHPECAKVVSEVTGIDVEMLLHKRTLADFSIAQRMSWAAQRHATRVEDRAYSLLGMFDVQMPMIYGEGQKAFVRLQEQIVQTTTDHTIFCWKTSPSERIWDRSLLARSPSQFAGCNNIEQIPITSPRPYQMTNVGLEMTLPLRAYIRDPKSPGLTRVRLDCTYREVDKRGEKETAMDRSGRPQRIMLNLQRQFDRDAEASDGFKPWTGRLRRRWRDAWDDMLGRSFDYHFVASHARRAFAVGHTTPDSRLKYGDDDVSQFREQTIVILRDRKDGAGVASGLTSNPIAYFNELDILAQLIFGGAATLLGGIPIALAVIFLSTLGSQIEHTEELPPQEESMQPRFPKSTLGSQFDHTEELPLQQKPMQPRFPKNYEALWAELDEDQRESWYEGERERLRRLTPPAHFYEDDPGWWAEERAEIAAAHARLRKLKASHDLAKGRIKRR
ncbi:hypothetical protein Q7P37_003855 [Cladosporium fusiforme]